MRMIAAVCGLLLATAAHAAEPRAVVGHVADQIAARYFDETKAAALAAELKAEAARGAYDRYADPLDLAQALTQRLKPADGHFQVLYQAAAQGQPAGGPRAPAQAAENDRRQNYGFRGVEVLPGNIALLNISSFANFRGPDDPARQAADAAVAMTAGADAVIVDLRDNGGGSPAMVGYLVGHFVPDGADIFNTFKSRAGPDRKETPPLAPAMARRTDIPLYVLTSGRTASAAESFAYTLQAAKRAVVVGEPSAGGANPGGFIPAGDGFVVFVSGGRPVNPITGTNWEGVGVKPDVAAPVAEAVETAERLALTKLMAAPQSDLARTEDQWALAALAPAAKLAPKALAEYAGPYGARTVKVEDGRVVVAASDRRPKTVLKAVGPDVFAIEGATVPIRVKFDRDPAGKVTGFVQMFGDGRTVRFARTG